MFAGLCFFLFHSIAFSRTCSEILVDGGRDRDWLKQFAMIRALDKAPTRSLEDFRPQVGLEVTRRDEQDRPIEGRIRVLSDNSGNQISILADFNGWGRSMTSADHLRPVHGTPYFEGRVRELHDAMEYRLLLNGRQVLDPAAVQFSTPEMIERFRLGATPYLNSVFSDLNGMKSPRTLRIDFRSKPVLIAEISVYELAQKWRESDQVGPPQKAETYRFIAKSGIPRAIARRGYTHLELLPFNSSVDGESWHYRYQVFGLFGPDSRYGTPDEFRQMISAFSREGVGVIMDAVLGHYPHRGNSRERSLEEVGIHHFVNGFGKPLFGGVPTIWGTYRWDYHNPYVRKFLIDAVLQNLKYFSLSGMRVDNVDGIREQPGGSLFLAELAAELLVYAPDFLIVGEMFSDQSPALRSTEAGGLGFHAANDVDFFYNFVQTFLQGWDHEFQVRRLEWFLNDAWRWNRPFMQRWITNHDEAANRQPGASGDYIATLLKGGSWDFVIAKTKVWGALALTMGSVYLDMLQMRFLQEGSFNTNPAIDWDLLTLDSQARVDSFFSTLTSFVRDNPAFAPHNIHDRISNHYDEDNKVVSLFRRDFASGKKTYILINFASRVLRDYAFGIEDMGQFTCSINSDATVYGGKNLLAAKVLTSEKLPIHGKSYRLKVPVLAPQSVLILQEE